MRHFIYIIVLIISSTPISIFPQKNLKVSVNAPGVQNPVISFESVAINKIKVVVTDSGVPVTGLVKYNFQISTEMSKGVIKKVEPLIKPEHRKISIVFCIDNSSSMGEHIGFVRETLNELLNRLGPSAKIASVFFLEGYKGSSGVGFESQPNIVFYSLTKEKDVIRETFERYLSVNRLSEKTYLFDELYTAIKILEPIQDSEEQRFVIVLSGGKDNASSQKKKNINSLVEKNPEIKFYTIDFLQKTNSFLNYLARRSHGRHFQAKKAEDLSLIFEDISRDIVALSGYLITYKIPMALVAGRLQSSFLCEQFIDAKVSCYPVDFPQYRTNLVVDQIGAYKFKAAIPHHWIVRASAPGFIDDSTVVDVDAEEIYLADISLIPAIIVLQGKITDSGTTPLSGAQIIVTDLGTGNILFEGDSDSLGAYEFETRHGSDVLITCTKAGYTFSSVELNNTSHNSIVPDIQLGLTAEGFVSEFRFLFALNSDKLDKNDISTKAQIRGCIDIINREFAKSPTRMVRLIGWTDSLGTVAYNLNLSQRRALYVKSYMQQNSISGARITAEGKGISYKYDNATKDGRALNRRTDVVFFDQPSVTEKLPEQNK